MIDIEKIKNGKLIKGDSAIDLKRIPSESIDVIVTDPPYGYSFMGKNWDKALPDIEIFKECLRVLKPGAFAFVMAAPRQDVLSRMMIKLEDAGFKTDFSSIYWTYATGFPKANNIGKAIDKRLGKEREIIGTKKQHDISNNGYASKKSEFIEKIKGDPISDEAKQFEGSYGGFQPKPAVEVIIVAQKPGTHRTQCGQALDNGKGVTWLDDCRIPYANAKDFTGAKVGFDHQNDKPQIYELGHKHIQQGGMDKQGRFPANLLVSDDVLQHESKGALAPVKLGQKGFGGEIYGKYKSGGDDGRSFYSDKETSTSYSRFFSLDAWTQRNLPFLIVPKASKKEKDAGCEKLPIKLKDDRTDAAKGSMVEKGLQPSRNNHPTVKPIKLMSYLIIMGSREGDFVLDPFCGAGTTLLAARLLGRKFIGIELEEKYYEIAFERLQNVSG
jgi:site-specific DNA-methyltransferase (adenine-specific)